MILIQLPWVHSVQQIRIREGKKWTCRSVNLDHQALPHGWNQKFLSRHFCSPRGFYLLSIHDLLYGRGDHNTVKSMRQTKTKLLVAFSFIITYAYITYLLPLLNCVRPQWLYLPNTPDWLWLLLSLMPEKSQAVSRIHCQLISDYWWPIQSVFVNAPTRITPT